MTTAYPHSRGRLVTALLFVALLAGGYHLSPVTVPEPFARARPVQYPQHSYHIPDASAVGVPNFGAIKDVQLRKKTFLDFLQPFVDAKNNEVRMQRRRLELIAAKLQRGQRLRQDENRFLWDLALNYEVKTDDLHDEGFIDRLLHRVDILPPSLVLAQAANESAWGTSRFAKEGNNFFGQWCYQEGCGLVPVRRRANASHEVKSFSSIEESVSAYFRNLNTNPGYQDLRLTRQALRSKEQPIDGISLTEGLERYSERGEAYVDDLQRMIYRNNLLNRDRTLYP